MCSACRVMIHASSTGFCQVRPSPLSLTASFTAGHQPGLPKGSSCCCLCLLYTASVSPHALQQQVSTPAGLTQAAPVGAFLTYIALNMIESCDHPGCCKCPARFRRYLLHRKQHFNVPWCILRFQSTLACFVPSLQEYLDVSRSGKAICHPLGGAKESLWKKTLSDEGTTAIGSLLGQHKSCQCMSVHNAAAVGSTSGHITTKHAVKRCGPCRTRWMHDGHAWP